MTDNPLDLSSTDVEVTQSAACQRTSWPALLLRLAFGLALSAIAASALLHLSPLLSLVARMGKDGLTLDELKALDMLGTAGALVPVAPNPLGWTALVLPFGLFAYAGLYRDLMRRLYLLAAALTGVSVALGLLFKPPLAHTIVMMAAIGAALSLHLVADDRPTQVGKSWLAALAVVLLGQLCHLISESFLSDTSLSVMALTAFAGQISYDLRRPVGSTSVEQAFTLYPSLAGAAMAVGILVR